MDSCIQNMTEGGLLAQEVKMKLRAKDEEKAVFAGDLFRVLTAIYLVDKDTYPFVKEKMTTLQKTAETIGLEIVGYSLSKKEISFSQYLRDKYGDINSDVGTLAERMYRILAILASDQKVKDADILYSSLRETVREVGNSLIDYSHEDPENADLHPLNNI